MKYTIDTFPDRMISVNGKSYLYFGGTSYLGLQTDATFQTLLIENIKKYGTNYGASRKANIQISIFEETETHLANLVGSESCITMSSGYLAGQLVAKSLNLVTHEFFYAPESHSALHISTKKPYKTYEDLNAAVIKHIKTSKSIPVIFLDAISILEGGYPEFEGLKNLPLEKIILVVDDSHGIGIVGTNGCGSFQRIQQLKPKEVIVSCSLGKGYGIPAGAIAGTKKRIEQFKNTSFFGGASPAAPAALATLLDGKNLFKKKRNQLQQNIQSFLNSLKNPKKLKYIENYPAFYFSNPKVATFLQENGILITNFNYPNENSPMVSRIVISAAHTKEDILLLAKHVNTFF